MAVPESTRWPITPHTKAKHLILQKYLVAWLPIMARYNGRVVFVDGFAGPGRYEGGEPGSPLIALKALLDHKAFSERKPGAEFYFLFIEKEPERAAALKSEINQLSSERPFPPWIQYDVLEGEFESHMTTLLDELDQGRDQLAPALVFIDPFGFRGLPMTLIKRIAKHPHCECFITLMYESVNRFWEHPEPGLQRTLDDLFGTSDGRVLIGNLDPQERFEKITNLYQRQLRQTAGFKYVRSFAMIDEGNRIEDVLMFGSKDATGLGRMKEAMWKADADRGFAFSDRTDPRQPVLFRADPAERLKAELQRRFRGRGFVAIGEVKKFVQEETAYLERSHLNRKTLGPMERASEIVVLRPKGARKIPGQYPEGTTISFV